jgi:hypothetical protein
LFAEAGVFGLLRTAPILSTPLPEDRPHHGHKRRDDVHLRSTKAATSYAIHAIDGEAGSVTRFMVDGPCSHICELVVQAGHWYAGQTIYIRTKNIKRINYADYSVFVNLSKADIAQTMGNVVAYSGTK